MRPEIIFLGSDSDSNSRAPPEIRRVAEAARKTCCGYTIPYLLMLYILLIKIPLNQRVSNLSTQI